MVTFMDISLFAKLGPIFMFLLVFAIVYGILSLTKIFKGVGGEQGLYGLIALVSAIFVVISKSVFSLIGSITPLFAALIVFIFLIFIVIKMFVGDDNDLFANMIKEGPLKWVLVVLFVVILIIGLSSTFGQDMLEEGSGIVSDDHETVTTSNNVEMPSSSSSSQNVVLVESSTINAGSNQEVMNTGTASSEDFSSNVLETFTHPKILGMILLLLIGFFAILFMTQANN
ncbi:MAG: hypothetical protein U9R00_02670 [Patescibacteria group bacterium]|nr:hypothetical protein [Patescibacteria group bacterium]